MRNRSWPFKNLDIGQSCTIPANLVPKARAYVHVYGGQTGKRFSCRAQPDGSLIVTRKPLGERRIVLTLEELHALASTFSKARLRELAPILAGHFKIEKFEDRAELVQRDEIA